MEIKVFDDRSGRSMTENQKRTVWNALFVAAERFRDDAGDMRKAEARARAQGMVSIARGYERLAEQFEKQDQEARELIETFE